MPRVHEVSAICGMSPKLASMLLFSPLMTFKTVQCRLGNSLFGEKTYRGKWLAPNQMTHSVVAPHRGHCHLGLLVKCCGYAVSTA